MLCNFAGLFGAKEYSTHNMDATKRKQLEDKIKADQYFIEKMLSKGEKFCSYPLIIDAMRDAEDRIRINKAELEAAGKE